MNRPLGAHVSGFSAFIIAYVLDAHLPAELVKVSRMAERGHVDPARLVEVRDTWAQIKAARSGWVEWRASVDGRTEALPAEMPAVSTQEIDTATAADLLRVTSSRVRQMVRSGDLLARKQGGVWLLDRSEIEMRRTAA
ncbi:hypothetical protein GCM10009827_083830 [Dactylosporangium maewongense]|uniref:Helix-turn-helix domain-containing protein n=1 Tax=Dactylosporangium maewongense TaxID=634393 RepID=A0ABP4MV71_9ACTN